METILTALVGVNFRPAEAREIVDQLGIGDDLALERDPSNEYDSNAVRVLHGDTFIGFIARDDNPAIAEHLDNGGRAETRVVGFLGRRKPSLNVTLID